MSNLLWQICLLQLVRHCFSQGDDIRVRQGPRCVTDSRLSPTCHVILYRRRHKPTLFCLGICLLGCHSLSPRALRLMAPSHSHGQLRSCLAVIDTSPRHSPLQLEEKGLYHGRHAAHNAASGSALLSKSRLSGLLCCSSMLVMNVPLLPCTVKCTASGQLLCSSAVSCHTSPDCLMATKALPHVNAATTWLQHLSENPLKIV